MEFIFYEFFAHRGECPYVYLSVRMFCL